MHGVLVSMTLSKILAALPALSRRDLGLVRGAADRLLGASAGTAGPLYSALQTATGSNIPFSRFQKTAAAKSWVENETATVSFIDSTWPDLGKVQRNALMIYLLGLIVLDLKSRKIPATLGSVAMNLNSLPQIFEANFPDYRECGLAHLVLKAMVQK